MKKKVYIILILIGVLGISITWSNPFSKSSTNGISQPNGLLYTSDSESSIDKTVSENGSYHFSVLSALDFLSIKGEKVQEEDYASLEKESVVILEISSGQLNQNFFDSKDLLLTKDAALSYLMGGLIKDVVVIQNNNENFAHTIHYDASMIANGKARVFLFFKDLMVKDELEITFNDRMLGNSQIKYRNN